MTKNDRVKVSSPLFADSQFGGEEGTVVCELDCGWIQVELDNFEGYIPFQTCELEFLLR